MPLLRLVVPVAALIGLAGVALAAMAAHAAPASAAHGLDISRLLYTASAFCLVHAPALLALVALSPRLRFAPVAAGLLVAGILLFCGDLVMRARSGTSLFPMAAPAGGFALMGGWLVLAIGGLFARSHAVNSTD